LNLGYIKSEIYNLGFSTADDVDINIVIQAINRAISTIASTVRPIIGSHRISQYPLKNAITDSLNNMTTRHYDGAPIVIVATGKSYYFECDGIGTATIVDSLGTTVVTLDGNKEFKAYKGFCNGYTTITFGGDYSYNLRNLAIYSELISNNVEDIPPYAINRFYDFKAIAEAKGETFVEFMDKDKLMGDMNANFSPINDFDVINRHILRLSGFDKAEFTIYYKKEYTHITLDTTDDFEMELDTDLHCLIPLLSAYYVWQDDEERKADKWYNDYETKRNDIIGRETRVIAVVESGDELW
jgi:hypothetical protein